MIVWWQWLCFGFSAGFATAWIYFKVNRLIRTREEWYADPKVKKRFGDKLGDR